ncbi:MAG: class II aldolase/adducin family protein [Tepidiformaceae bacterium]
MADVLAELRAKVALACRILAQQGLVRDIIGHVSARVPGTGEMLIRCRGEDEYGLRFTTTGQVRRLDFDGHGDGLGAAHVAPIELPIHGEIYKARPDAGAVVHAHPRAALFCGLAGIELRPLFGAYDPYALELAAAGVPVFPRSVLIDSAAVAGDLIRVMGAHSVCLMRGHGIAVIGDTVEQAAVRALKLEALAEVAWQLAAAGRDVDAIPPEELASFTARSEGKGVIPGGERWLWRHYARLAEEDVPALPTATQTGE